MNIKVDDKFVLVDSVPYISILGPVDSLPTFTEVVVVQAMEALIKAVGVDGTIFYKSIGISGGPVDHWIKTRPINFDSLTEDRRNDYFKKMVWYDVTQFSVPAPPKFCSQFPYVKFCPIHQVIYYDRGKCDLCLVAKDYVPPVKLNTIDHCWTGWYDFDNELENN